MIHSIVDILRERAVTDAQRIAYTYLTDRMEEESLTFEQVYRRSCSLAQSISESTAPGDRVLIILPPGLDYILAFYACLIAGRIAVPCYPPINGRGMERIMALIKTATPALIIGPASHRSGLEPLAKISRCAALFPEDVDQTLNATDPMLSFEQDQVAFLQFTSGSTGAPKGVMVTHGNLVANLEAIQDCFGLSTTSVGVSWLPPYHDMGLVAGILGAVYVGGRSINMSPFAFIQRPARWLEAIARYKGNVSGGPNFAYRLCRERLKPEERAALDLSSWNVAFCGAEPIAYDNLKRFAETFAESGFRESAVLNCYGLAESTLIVSGTRGGIHRQGQRVSCGEVIPQHQVLLVDPQTHRAVADGEEGEVWMRGGSVAAGYWSDELKTHETFGARLADSEGDETFMRTGDLGYFHDGHLYITGRLKDMLIIRGTNYYPQDIEAVAAERCEALNGGSIAAFPVALDGAEELVVVAEIRKSFRRLEDKQPLLAEIMGAISENFSLRPADIVIADAGSVPKTTSGKIRRQQCRQDYLAGKINPLVALRQTTATTAGS